MDRLGNLAEPDLDRGQPVGSHERIGALGSPKQGTSALHFEVLRNDVPIAVVLCIDSVSTPVPVSLETPEGVRAWPVPSPRSGP